MSEDRPKPPSMGKALAHGSTIGVQAGCISVLFVLLALGAGLLLDQWLNTKPLFVLGLLLLSIPVSLVAMVYSVLRSTRSMRDGSSSDQQKEDNP